MSTPDAGQFSLFDPPAAAELPDAAARRRIVSDLRTSLIVEAGAGAGKTTEMVRRMVALVRSGLAEVSGVAAVTFTRKAAAELRERFQTALEAELRDAVEQGDSTSVARLDAALREIDRAFLGTIHAFCARLLRERPLDAGVDPGFRETLGAEEKRMRSRFWTAWLEQVTAEGDPLLAEVREAGLRPQQLRDLFEELSQQPDVDWRAARPPRPDPSGLRRVVEQIMDDAARILPAEEPAAGWDSLQVTLRMLRFHRFVVGWTDDARFLDALAPLTRSSFDATLNRWPDGDAVKAVRDRFQALVEEGGALNALLREWWAWRYPIALSFAGAAAAAYEAERLRAGTLNFQDLLMLAARLLRRSPAARRELSERYRYILVDEFQDTDPIQAEVLFLLASDEEPDLFREVGEGRAAFASWRHLTPRPGALFVVGDPKQSIYRFRRADMTLYQQVRSRFEVVELTSNFRSRPAIEGFVNENFRDRFPADNTEEQARFAPMKVQRQSPAGRVQWYELDDPVYGRVPQLAAQDAERLATWIGQRIDSGERRPGDFLLLTPNTKWLATYASSLEARNIPVQVTGAGVGGPDNVELQELLLLLRCLCDPGDPTLSVAVLTGLFYGIDHERLVQHAEAAGRAPFSFTAQREADAPGQAEVKEALNTLNRFWRMSRVEPADVAVARMVDELGVLPFAAAGELGGSRAGALLFALDAVRAASVHGDSSLAGAHAALEAALEEADSEAPLEPGRSDVVRVMNLHKAKGLEAPVVILAMPFGEWMPEPAVRVVRDRNGGALGFTRVCEKVGKNRVLPLAQPADWDQHVAEEMRFQRAERERLLYVAATRAGEELIVGAAYNARSPSPWRSFLPWLKAHAERLDLPQPERGVRPELQQTGSDVMAAAARIDADRAGRSRATYRVAPVSERKAGVAEAVGDPGPGVPDVAADEASTNAVTVPGRGTDWGTAVHDGLQLAAQGVTGAALRSACRDRLVALDRPADPAGEPVELAELMAVIEAVLGSPLWQRARAADLMLVEVPFSVRVEAQEYITMTGAAPDDVAPAEIIDGRVDLAFREAAGWVIVDYKTDAAGVGIPAPLMARYRAQLRLYAEAWQRITGESVVETALLFTAAA